MKRFISILAFLTGNAFLHAEKEATPQDYQKYIQAPLGYQVETIALPQDREWHISGIAPVADQSLYFSTREGEIWSLDLASSSQNTQSPTLFAQGLHEPQGLLYQTTEKALYTAQRSELTRIQDQDQDGRADWYQTIANWDLNFNYHEYAYGPVLDQQGNFYGTLNLSHNPKTGVRKSVMGASSKDRGTTWKLDAQGKFHTHAYGLRSPAGVGISPAGEVFFTENQGDWVETSYLAHSEAGDFHGHPASMRFHPDYQEKDLEQVPIEEWESLRKRPAVFFPHGVIASSPGDPVFDQSQGKFGPFAGQLFFGCQTLSSINRVYLEKIEGQWQGTVFPFIRGMMSGCIRTKFDAQGNLWVGQTGRGWRARGPAMSGLQKVSWDANTTPFEILKVELKPQGFLLTFTQALPTLSAEVWLETVEIKHWRYQYRNDYGSPVEDQNTIEELVIAPLGDTQLMVTCPTSSLQKERIYHLRLEGLTSQSQQPLLNSDAYYTLNRMAPTQ